MVSLRGSRTPVSAVLRTVLHPVRLLPVTFLVGIVVGTGLLMIPAAHRGPGPADPMAASFTSVSAVTVTGLVNVDTATYWTPFGHVIILLLAQIGGFGIVTLATILGVFVGGRLGLRSRMAAQVDLHLTNLGDVVPLLRRIALVMLAFEAVLAVVLAWRFRVDYDESWGQALWNGLWYAVMGFNNAGFSLHPDGLVSVAGDAWLVMTICVAVYVGAIGFPVLAELFRRWRHPSRWTIHTRLTVWGSLLLFVIGALVFAAAEWENPATLGTMSTPDKIVTSIEGGVMTRSGGFASIDYGQARPETTFFSSILMFIGGGSASTAGGIKITTFLLLAYAILAEVRGDPEVAVGSRKIGSQTLRQALTIALLAVMLVAASTLALLALGDVSTDEALFECSSAFGTAGLSMGVTGDLPAASQLILMFLMFVGRVGTVAAASALALRGRPRRFHLPEERPIIG